MSVLLFLRTESGIRSGVDSGSGTDTSGVEQSQQTSASFDSGTLEDRGWPTVGGVIPKLGILPAISLDVGFNASAGLSYPGAAMGFGPKVYYRLNDAVGVSTIRDEAGNLEPTQEGSITRQANSLLSGDPANKAFNFDGVPWGYLDVRDNIPLLDTDVLTLVAIIKPQVSGNEFIISRSHLDGLNVEQLMWGLRIYNGYLQFVMRTTPDSLLYGYAADQLLVYSGTKFLSLNTEYHVAAIVRENAVELYVDGEMTDSWNKSWLHLKKGYYPPENEGDPPTKYPTYLAIGAVMTSSSPPLYPRVYDNFYYGILDEVSVYLKALNPEDIKYLSYARSIPVSFNWTNVSNELAIGNQVRNPSMETNLTNWGGYQDETAQSVTPTRVSGTGGGAGNYVGQVTYLFTGSSRTLLMYNNGYTLNVAAPSVTKFFRIRVKVAAQAGQSLVVLYTRPTKSDGSLLTPLEIGRVSNPITGLWYTIYGTALMPLDTAWIGLQAYLSTSTPGTYTLQVDGAVICDVIGADEPDVSELVASLDDLGNPGYVDGTMPLCYWEGTPHASRTYLTRLSETTRLYEFATQRGRQDELREAETGVFNGVLRNQDRRFDPANPSSPYSPELKPVKPIWCHGIVTSEEITRTFSLFRGDTDNWPQDWKGRVNDLPITGLDAFDVLSQVGVNVSGPVEKTGARIHRILDAAMWPSDLRVIETGLTDVQEWEQEKDKARELLNRITKAESGYLYIDGYGRVVFKQRNTTASPIMATFSNVPTSTELPYAAAKMVKDKEWVKNDIRIQVTNGPLYVAQDPQSIRDHRIRTLEMELPLLDDGMSGQAKADWLLSLYKDPVERIREVVLEPQMDDRLWHHVLVRDIGDRVRFKVHPPGGGSVIDLQSIIEYVGHKYIVGRWTTTWIMSPADVSGYWIIGTSTLGETTKLAY